MTDNEADPTRSPSRAAVTDRGSVKDRAIALRLGWSFGAVAGVAVLMCGMLLVQLGELSQQVDAMRSDEQAVRRSGELSGAIREQYIHLAHTLVEGDGSHVGHYAEWGETALAHVEALRGQIPASEAWRLDRIARASVEIDGIFTALLIPALEVGDRATVRAQHHEVEVLADRAAADADAIAQAVETRMAAEHAQARRVTRRGFGWGATGVFLVLLLSGGATIGLRRAVLRPLWRLAEAARRLGEGATHERLGTLGRGELQQVANAFDHMADELVARERRLVAVERMAAIGQLAAGVAHEMNNPIGIIRGYLKTMSADEDAETLTEELQILDEEAAACQRIADDLLVYARAPGLVRVPTAMADYVTQSVERLVARATLPLASVRVSLEVSTEPASICCDRGRLRQVLANLLLNAAQASPAGSEVIVRAGPTSDGGYRLCVLDRGPGIPPAERDRIFEPFFTRRAAGSGLGLAVSQGIVAQHGGRIDVGDRPSGGAAFCVWIPERLGAEASRAGALEGA